LIVSGSMDQSIRIWRAADGVFLAEYKQIQSSVLSLAFSAAQDKLAIGYFDGSIIVLGVGY
jgi:WD40 repeat protein